MFSVSSTTTPKKCSPSPTCKPTGYNPDGKSCDPGQVCNGVNCDKVYIGMTSDGCTPSSCGPGTVAHEPGSPECLACPAGVPAIRGTFDPNLHETCLVCDEGTVPRSSKDILLDPEMEIMGWSPRSQCLQECLKLGNDCGYFSVIYGKAATTCTIRTKAGSAPQCPDAYADDPDDPKAYDPLLNEYVYEVTRDTHGLPGNKMLLKTVRSLDAPCLGSNIRTIDVTNNTGRPNLAKAQQQIRAMYCHVPPPSPLPISSQCPAWARGEEEYTYNEDEWGGDLTPLEPGFVGPAKNANEATQKKAALNTACAWLASCNKLSTTEAMKECRSNCPRAVGMSHNESGWHPHAQAGDGWGRGLFQWGGPASPACVHGFTGQACGVEYNGNTIVPHDGGGATVQPSACTAYNPLDNIAAILPVTNNGNHWRPKWNEWNACQPTGIREWAELNTDSGGNLAVDVCQTAATDAYTYDTELNDYSTCMNGDAMTNAMKTKADVCASCTPHTGSGDGHDTQYCLGIQTIYNYDFA